MRVQVCGTGGECTLDPNAVPPPQAAINLPPTGADSADETPPAAGFYVFGAWGACEVDCGATVEAGGGLGEQRRTAECSGDCRGLGEPETTRECLDVPCADTACDTEPCGAQNQCAVALDASGQVRPSRAPRCGVLCCVVRAPRLSVTLSPRLRLPPAAWCSPPVALHGCAGRQRAGEPQQGSTPLCHSACTVALGGSGQVQHQRTGQELESSGTSGQVRGRCRAPASAVRSEAGAVLLPTDAVRSEAGAVAPWNAPNLPLACTSV